MSKTETLPQRIQKMEVPEKVNREILGLKRIFIMKLTELK